MILSGVMMLKFLGWQVAADLVTKGLSAAIANQQSPTTWHGGWNRRWIP